MGDGAEFAINCTPARVDMSALIGAISLYRTANPLRLGTASLYLMPSLATAGN